MKGTTHELHCSEFLKKMNIKKKNWWMDLSNGIKKDIMGDIKGGEEVREEQDQDFIIFSYFIEIYCKEKVELYVQIGQ